MMRWADLGRPLDGCAIPSPRCFECLGLRPCLVALRPCASVASEFVHAKPCVLRRWASNPGHPADWRSALPVELHRPDHHQHGCRLRQVGGSFLHVPSASSRARVPCFSVSPKDLHRSVLLACRLPSKLFSAIRGSGVSTPTPDPPTPVGPWSGPHSSHVQSFCFSVLGLLDSTRTVELKTDSTRDRAREAHSKLQRRLSMVNFAPPGFGWIRQVSFVLDHATRCDKPRRHCSSYALKRKSFSAGKLVSFL